MNYFQRYLAEEFAEDYQEGILSRREALKLITAVTGSFVLANSILAACVPLGESTPIPSLLTEAPAPNTPTSQAATPEPAPEATASPEQPAASPEVSGIESTEVGFPGEGVQLSGYLARPTGESRSPVVLVCHENRGLTDHIKDVTRRLAEAGYVALAVDLLTRQGGTAALSPDQVPGILGNTPPDQFVEDFLSGWRFLQDQDYAQADRVGMVGFCFGGGITWLMATRMPQLLAAVPFYGPHPPAAEVANINAAVLGIYAGRDERINQAIPAIEEAMRQHGKIYEKVIYPDTDHAFHNDTGPRYNAEAAQDAWRRTIQWFQNYLNS